MSQDSLSWVAQILVKSVTGPNDPSLCVSFGVQFRDGLLTILLQPRPPTKSYLRHHLCMHVVRSYSGS